MPFRAGFNRVARAHPRSKGDMRRLSLSGGAIPVLLAVCPAALCLLAVSAQPAGAHGSCDQRGHARSSHRYAPRAYMHHDEHGDGHGCGGHDDDHHGNDDHGGFSPPCTTYLPGASREVPTNTIEGTPGPDKIVGTNGPDLIYGFGGADRIYGGGGDDHVIGGPGDDRIDGANGDDNLWGGPGDDSIRGANGSDHVVGGNGHDRLDGGAGCDNMLGGSGDDELEGGPDVDKLDGDNAAPAFGFGTADSCDGGPGDDLFVNCELP